MRAVIFDMDGVLADTQIIHSEVEHDILKRHGCSLSQEVLSKRYAGVPCAKFFAEYINDPDELAASLKEKWERTFKMTPGNVRAIKGAERLVLALHERRVPIAVASGSRKEYIELVLKELGLRQYFDAAVSSDEVAKGKPSPDVFLLAAERLGVPPEECTVIEDGVAGMQAARKAGMRSIGLMPDGSICPADRTVRSLEEIRPEELL